MTTLASKVALIAGGASGMGASHARAIALAGERVMIGDIQDDAGQAVADHIGAQARFMHLDVASSADWSAAVTATLDAFRALNVLVNNAGIINAGPLGRYSKADFRDVISVNVVGTFLGMSAAVEARKRDAPASIINISSTAGITGVAEFRGYTACKFAIRGPTKSAALELGSHGVRVNSVDPGLVRTPMSTGVPESLVQNVFHRFAEPEEVSAMVVFLAGDDSRFSTGSEFEVDGGETAGSETVRLSELPR